MKLSLPRFRRGALVCLLALPFVGCAGDIGDESSELEGAEILEAVQPIVATSSTPDYLRCICRDETTGESQEAQICANTSCSSGPGMVAACGTVCGTKTVLSVACHDDAPRCTQAGGTTPTAGTLTATPNVLECTCGDNSTPQAAVPDSDCATRAAEQAACTTLCGSRGAPKAQRCVRGTKRLAEAPTPRMSGVTYDSSIPGYVGDRSYSSRNLQISCTCRDNKTDLVCAPTDTTNGVTWTLNANSCTSSFVQSTCSNVCGGATNIASSSCLSSGGRYTSSFFGLVQRWNEGNDLCFWGAPKPNLVECTCGNRNIRTCANIKASALASNGERNLLNDELRNHCTPICSGFGGYVPNAYITQESYSSLCTYSHM